MESMESVAALKLKIRNGINKIDPPFCQEVDERIDICQRGRGEDLPDI